MASVIPFDGRGPVVRVHVDTTATLNLGDVGRFLQRLDTGTRRVAVAGGVRAPRVQVVSLEAGSPLDTKLKLISVHQADIALAISAASLALNLATYLRTDPAAAQSSQEILVNGNGNEIIVEGGGVQKAITQNDLRPVRAERLAASRDTDVQVLRGPQQGFVTEIAGGYVVELDSHPGLFIRIEDQRRGSEPLLPHARYTLDGEAHITKLLGRASYFKLRRAHLTD
jgi:hypothetical protein